MSTKKYHYIDVLKGIGILFVLLGHTRRPELMLKIIQAFHMPFFFIISGYLYNNEKYLKIGSKDYIKHRLQSYIRPYIIIGSICYFVYGVIICYIKLDDIHEYIKRLLRYFIGMAYSRGTWYWMPQCSPLWYLTAIFVASILFYYIMRFGCKYQILIVGVCMILGSSFSIIDVMKLPWNIDSAFLGVFYMYIGYNMKKYQTLKVIKPIQCLYLLPIGLLAAYYNKIEFVSMDSIIYGNILLMLIGSIFISVSICVLVYNFLPENQFLEYWGMNTVPVLGFNYIINYFIDWLNELLGVCKQVTWEIQFMLDIIIMIPFVFFWNYFYPRMKYK